MESRDNTVYQLAARMAIVAGGVLIVACALLVYDYARRLAKDPFEAPIYSSLRAALEQQPTNEALKEHFRAVDLELRREFFRQRAFARSGAVLAIVSLAVMLFAWRVAVNARRRPPAPEALDAAVDREAMWTGRARWAVGGVCGVLIMAALYLIINAGLSGAGGRYSLADFVRAGTKAPSPEANQALRRPSNGIGEKRDARDETPPKDAEVAKAWPRFRGPSGLGISAYGNVPERWDAKTGQGIVWKSAVPLPGNNSPVVWGTRVFLSGADKTKREVYCFDADSGKLLWQHTVPGTPPSAARAPKVLDDTGYAAPTMATDGHRAFAIFANGDLAAFSVEGKPAWSKSLGMPENSYGHASSLLVHKNLLLVQLDQGGSSEAKKSRMLALETASGRVVWQVTRPVPNSWSTPIVIHAAGRDQLITAADPWVISYEPASGKEWWRADCLKTDIGPSPAFADGRVYVANENSELSAIQADGQGDVTATHVVWKGEEGMPDTCSPLATKEFVFLLTSFGTLTCYDARKGGVLWAEDLATDFAASPSLVGSRLYLVSKTGKSFLVEPTRKGCKRVAEGDLGERCVTSPAFQDGRIYLRGSTHLYCLGESKH